MLRNSIIWGTLITGEQYPNHNIVVNLFPFCETWDPERKYFQKLHETRFKRSCPGCSEGKHVKLHNLYRHKMSII